MPTTEMNFEFFTITGFGNLSYFGYNYYDIVATPICQAFFKIFSKKFLLLNSIPASITFLRHTF